MADSLIREPIDVTDNISTRRFLRQYIELSQANSAKLQVLEKQLAEEKLKNENLEKRVVELEKKP